MTRPNFVKLTDDQVRARKRRNIAIALGLLAFIGVVYLITVTRMYNNSQERRAAEAAAVGVVERADPALPAPVQPAAPAPTPTEPAA